MERARGLLVCNSLPAAMRRVRWSQALLLLGLLCILGGEVLLNVHKSYPSEDKQSKDDIPQQVLAPMASMAPTAPTAPVAPSPPLNLQQRPKWPSPVPIPSFDPANPNKEFNPETLRVTFLGVPKRFDINPQVARAQLNALRSWSMLRPKPDIIIFGDEPGIEEVAQAIGALHVPNIARTPRGTPTLDFILKYGEAVANTTLICFANSDIIFTSDFITTLNATVQRFSPSPFLIVGRRTNLDISPRINFSHQNWEAKLLTNIRAVGRRFTGWGQDYFLHTVGLFTEIVLPFAIGRPAYDNWLLHQAWYTLNITTVDASKTLTAIHQRHDYGHIKKNAKGNFDDPDRHWNYALGRKQWMKGKTSLVPYVSQWCDVGKACIKRRPVE